ncbi:MAG: hypothetical protein ACRCWM_02370 [Sarcina sp.]
MNKTCTSNYLAKKLGMTHKELSTLIYLNPKLKAFLEPYNWQYEGSTRTSYLYYKGDEDFIINIIELIRAGKGEMIVC